MANGKRPRGRTAPRLSGARSRAAEVPASASLKLKSVLVPVDFSESSKKALAYAQAFARQFDAAIILLHVVEAIPWSADYGYGEVRGIGPDEYLVKRCRTRLETLRRRQAEASSRCRTTVRSGKAFDEIVKAAKELDVNLIILATHGYVGLDHMLLGSTVERIVRHAPCPVLIVRQHERDFICRDIQPSKPKGTS